MIVRCGDRIIADRVKPANTFFDRFIGLMGKRALGDGEGLLLIDCSSIHCFFMRITIDAVYLSKDLTVLGIETLRPWQIGRRIRHASHVLELPSAPEWLSVGDVLDIYEKTGFWRKEICRAQ